MKASPAAITLLTSAEGFSSTAYLDTAKIYTVGWGHALNTPTGQHISIGNFGDKAYGLAQEAMKRKFNSQTITKEQANALMLEDMGAFVDSLTKKLPPDTTQAQFDALLSFSYNVGDAAFDGSAVKRLHFAGKRSVGNLSLIDTCKASKAKQDPTTIALAFGRWSNSGGQWTLGLFRRRMAEVLVYSGWDGQKAIAAAWAFHD